MMSYGGGGEWRRVELRRCAGGTASASGEVAVEVEVGCGVDLGLVGLAVGVEPSTVRLNGYYLSRGPDLVCGVTWASLLSFFAARGVPVGAPSTASAGAGGPILVEGKPIAGLDCSKNGPLTTKRKITIEEDECQLKKLKLTEHNAGALMACNGQVSLTCNLGTKKRKIDVCSSGLADEACKLATMVAKTGFGGFNSINGHGKRLREDDIAAAVACKRIR